MEATLDVSARIGESRPRFVPAAPPSRSVDSPRRPVRFQVRPVLWGDRCRYEVVDTRTDTTLVVRATRVGADDDVIVLNMGGGGGPQVRHAPVKADELVGTRQCGRCRGTFPPDPAGDTAALQDWWLCGACRKALIGGHPGPASADPSVSSPTGVVVSAQRPEPIWRSRARAATQPQRS